MTNKYSRLRSVAVLVAVCLASASMPLAFTGPTVALPSIGMALGGSPVSISWATNAYLLTFGSLLLAAGSLADRYGRKLVFAIGTGGFAILSVMLALVPDMTSFNLVRAAEGVTAAATMSAGMAVLAQEFDGPGRMRAFSFVGASFGIGLSVAPIASGYLFEAFGWRSIFAVVVGFDLLAFIIGMFSIVETRDPRDIPHFLPEPGGRDMMRRSADRLCAACDGNIAFAECDHLRRGNDRLNPRSAQAVQRQGGGFYRNAGIHRSDPRR